MMEEISISVRFFGMLCDRLPADCDRGETVIMVPARTDVAGALARFGVSRQDARWMVVMVNGRQAGLDQVLEESDVLSAFPAVAGG